MSNKQFQHYKNTALQSLEKFKKLASDHRSDPECQLVVNDWEAFINDKSRLERFIDNVQDPARIFGFSRELSPGLSYEQLISRVAERFSEVDLAEHIIRELALPGRNTKLEKLAEDTGKKCDFKLPTNPAFYFESKFTKNLDIRYLKVTIKEALEQIKNSMGIEGGTGCVWFFTYTQPDNGRNFQLEIMKIKAAFSNIGFNFTLNIQVYGHGLYGDATVI